MNMFDIHTVALEGVAPRNAIEFLRVEIPERKGYGPIPFARVRVRYACNGTQQENVFPLDLGKGIFVATLEDDELGGLSRQELEENLRIAATEILEIVRREFSPPHILRTILKDYAYLAYDERGSEPPDILRCRVAKPETRRRAQDIFEIARRLKMATGLNYSVSSYGGSGSYEDKDNFDEVWTHFTLRILNFYQ